MVKVKEHKRFPGIFWVNNRLATINLTPGYRVYGEKLIKVGDKEFRFWEARRSKPSAAIYKGLKHFPLRKGMKVLYLGFASGTTGSHFSDIVGKKGFIYGIEISERVLREALPMVELRKNIAPLLADARKPEEYSWIEEVDLVYADIAIKEQSEILIRNSDLFLKSGGYAMIAIKSRSIDVTKPPKKVFKEQKKKLQEFFEIVDFVTLEPYEKDHGYFVLRA